jgi:predicted histone-like DNA-binding protein
MTVKYTVVARGKPGDPEAPKKYYPMVKSVGRVTLRQLAQRIADISTVSSVDTVAMLEALLTVIPRELAEGRTVQLGDLGTFGLRVRGEGAETAEAVTAHSITKTLIGFRPGKRFKEMLPGLSFEKM